MVFVCLDRPSTPAWQVRNAYRVAVVLLSMTLLAVTYAAVMLREELRFEIKAHQQLIHSIR